jgi:hypothetical protein
MGKAEDEQREADDAVAKGNEIVSHGHLGSAAYRRDVL